MPTTYFLRNYWNNPKYPTAWDISPYRKKICVGIKDGTKYVFEDVSRKNKIKPTEEQHWLLNYTAMKAVADKYLDFPLCILQLQPTRTIRRVNATVNWLMSIQWFCDLLSQQEWGKRESRGKSQLSLTVLPMRSHATHNPDGKFQEIWMQSAIPK